MDRMSGFGPADRGSNPRRLMIFGFDRSENQENFLGFQNKYILKCQNYFSFRSLWNSEHAQEPGGIGSS